jgi:hypothetical protein
MNNNTLTGASFASSHKSEWLHFGIVEAIGLEGMESR